MRAQIKKNLPAVLAAAMVFTAASGTSYAFLTHSVGSLVNKFTPGSIEVDLTEKSWDETKARNLLPRDVVSKDPVATNTGKNDSWIFLRVDIPVKNIRTVDETTKRKSAFADTELFTFEADDGWELVSHEVSGGYAHYVYGYKQVVKPGASTTALFDEVKLVNYLEGDLDKGTKLTIPVETVSIQSNVENADKGLSAVYKEFLAQEAADSK